MAEVRKVRIVGRVDSRLSQVEDAETGEVLRNVQRAEVVLEPLSTKAYLTLFDFASDFIVDAQVRKVCAMCGRDTETGETPAEQVGSAPLTQAHVQQIAEAVVDEVRKQINLERYFRPVTQGV